MARIRDITRRPKFFIKKAGYNEELLCEKCKHHNIVAMMKLGCDVLVFTHLALAELRDLNNINHEYLHLWCYHEDNPPPCLEGFRMVGNVR